MNRINLVALAGMVMWMFSSWIFWGMKFSIGLPDTPEELICRGITLLLLVHVFEGVKFSGRGEDG